MTPEKVELELKRSAITRAFDGATRTVSVKDRETAQWAVEGWMLQNLVEDQGGGYRISGSEHMSLNEFVRRQLQTEWSFLAAGSETSGKSPQPDNCPSIEKLISGDFTKDEERAARQRIVEILKAGSGA